MLYVCLRDSFYRVRLVFHPCISRKLLSMVARHYYTFYHPNEPIPMSLSQRACRDLVLMLLNRQAQPERALVRLCVYPYLLTAGGRLSASSPYLPLGSSVPWPWAVPSIALYACYHSGLPRHVAATYKSACCTRGAAESFGSTQYPIALAGPLDYDALNFTEIFASAIDKSSAPWTRGSFQGLTTFARAAPLRCLGEEADSAFDVAVLGAPFDTGTSFRPGARFGPNGIRQGSRRLGIDRINVPAKIRVSDHLEVADCGDVPMVLTDNRVALRQLELANAALLSRSSLRAYAGKSLAKDGKFHPRVLTLGGDHTITLPLLRGVAGVYGPVSVIHFDSHLDTWKPKQATGGPWLPGEEVPVSHGNYFWFAWKEGLLAPDNANIHVGIRGAINSWSDYEDDHEFGWVISHAEDLEEVGWKGVVKKIKDTVGDNPVYITFDIDVLDPSMAPATGTPEIGGITTREIKKIIQGLAGLKVVGADIVEVAPGYDTQDEITQIAAANVGWELLALMAKTPLTK